MRPPSSALTAPRRALLGPADVEDEELAAFVAANLGVPHATVLTSTAAVFPYDRPAITTAGRYLVTGSARTGTGEVRAFSFFVKVIRPNGSSSGHVTYPVDRTRIGLGRGQPGSGSSSSMIVPRCQTLRNR